MCLGVDDVVTVGEEVERGVVSLKHAIRFACHGKVGVHIGGIPHLRLELIDTILLQRHASVEVGGQQRPFPVDGVGEAVAIADAGDGGDVVEPSVMEDPTVAITDHYSEVAVTETVVGQGVGQVRDQLIFQHAHVHDHILVAQIDARHQRAGAALLVLGKAVGCGLGIMCVVKDVIGVKSVAFR